MTSPLNNRLAGLDTLRTCAIVSVMLFHLQGALPVAWEPVGNMGWLGVDLFFVPSGYLIGTQLLRRIAGNRRFNVFDFYRRRAYRILPVYLVVVALYLFIPKWREEPNLPATWKLLTFTANLWMNYPAERAFSHVWSLCIEEHFYLLLPVAVLLLARRRSALIVAAFIALFAAGMGIRWWMFRHIILPSPETDQWIPMMTRIYYPTYSRLDALLSGLALAGIRLFRPAWWNRVAAHGNALLLVGLLVLLGGMATFHFEYPSTDYPVGLVVGFTFVSLGFVLCVAAAVCPGGLLTRRIPGVQTIATLAFSLYLTHKAVAHVDRLLMPWMRDNRGLFAACVYTATCLVAAAALYITVEQPFLRLRDRGKNTARVSLEARIDPAL